MTERAPGEELLAVVEISNLPTTLATSASHWARRAVEAFADNDPVTVCVAAGQAIEHLAKAALVVAMRSALERDPASIHANPGGSQQSKAYLARRETPIRHLSDVFTVQIEDSVKKAMRLIPETSRPDWRTVQPDVEALKNGRDSAVHLGYANMWMGDNAMAAMVRVAIVITANESDSRDAILGLDDGRLVDALRTLPLVDKSVTPGSEGSYWRQRPEAHMWARGLAARNRWRRFVDRIPPRQLAAMVSALDHAQQGGILRPCPTAGHFAWYQDGLDDEGVTFDGDDDQSWRRRRLDRMECPLCGLWLEGERELIAFGVSEDLGFEAANSAE